MDANALAAWRLATAQAAATFRMSRGSTIGGGVLESAEAALAQASCGVSGRRQASRRRT